MRVIVGASVLAVVGAAGCVEQRFDVELAVTRAEALGDGVLQYNYGTDVDPVDASAASGKAVANGLALALDATTIQFEAEVLGAVVGFGRSPVLEIPDGGTLVVPLLVAPTEAPGLVASRPANVDDACIAADDAGAFFFMGGTGSTRDGTVFDTAFKVREFGAGAFANVASPTCAAHAGKVAVVDGATAVVFDVDGNSSTVDLDFIDVPAGAIAVPRSDDGLWVVDGDNDIFHVDANGVADPVATASGARTSGLEVTANDSLVMVAGGNLIYVDEVLLNLGPAQALGRRLKQVFVFDGDTISVIENAATTVVKSVSFPAMSSFGMLSDGRAVGLTAAGQFIDEDGSYSGRSQRAMVVLGGDVVLLGGSGNGFDGIAFR